MTLYNLIGDPMDTRSAISVFEDLKQHQENIYQLTNLMNNLEYSQEGLQEIFQGTFNAGNTIIHGIHSGLQTYKSIMERIGNFFYEFSEKNNEVINIYVKDIKDQTKKLDQLYKKDNTIYVGHREEEVPYIEGCKKDLLTLSQDLLKLNQSLDKKVGKMFDYVDKVISLTMSNKEYQTSKKPIHDQEFIDMNKLNKELQEFFQSTMDNNFRKDTRTLGEVIPNFKSLQTAVDNIVKTSSYTTLKDLRKFNEDTQDIKNKVDHLLLVLEDGETVIETSRLKHLNSVLEVSGSISTYVSGLITLFIDCCKTVSSIVRILDEY